jgi:hypothetical protein
VCKAILPIAILWFGCGIVAPAANAVAVVAAPAAGPAAGPAAAVYSPVSRTPNEEYIAALDQRIARDIPAAKTSDDARLDLEDAWLRRLDIIKKTQFHDLTSVEYDAFCRMNVEATAALVKAEAKWHERSVAFDLEVMNRFHRDEYKTCLDRQPSWKTLYDDALARARVVVRQPRSHWTDAAGSCKYVLLSGEIAGGPKTGDHAVVLGKEVAGISKRVEGYTVEPTIAGDVTKPKYVYREVVKSRDDMIAVLDTTDPLDGVAFGVDGMWVLGACAGTATTLSRVDNRRINVLAIRPIVITTADGGWKWAAWGLPPRRTVAGEPEHATGTKVIAP